MKRKINYLGVVLISMLLILSGCSGESKAVSEINGTFDVNVTNDIGSAGTFRGALNVHTEDVHFEMVNRYFMHFTGDITTLSVAVDSGERTHHINVTNSTLFTVGDYIFLSEGNTQELNAIEILSITGDELELRHEVDFSYSTLATVEKVIINLADPITVTASIENPIEFRLNPAPSEEWHILRVLLTCEDNTAFDNSKFCGGPPLTNGMTIVHENSINQTLSTWTTNDNIIDDMYNLDYTDKAGGGNFGMKGRWTFKNVDYTPAINGSLGDDLVLHVHDDMTGLINFHVKSQGHEKGK